MDGEKDIRWKQRFSNYKKALSNLNSAVELSQKRKLSELEKQGLVQSFEFTHELAWKVMKDFLEYNGISGIIGSRDAVRQAFSNGLVSNAEIWMESISDRNLSSHTYDEKTVDELAEKICSKYVSIFNDFCGKLKSYE